MPKIDKRYKHKTDTHNKCLYGNCKVMLPIEQTYCNDECAKNHQKFKDSMNRYLAKKALLSGKLPLTEMTCARDGCGNIFMPRRHGQIFCCRRCNNLNQYKVKSDARRLLRPNREIKAKVIKVGISYTTTQNPLSATNLTPIKAKRLFVDREKERLIKAKRRAFRQWITQYRKDHSSEIREQRKLNQAIETNEKLIVTDEECVVLDVAKVQVSNDYYR